MLQQPNCSARRCKHYTGIKGKDETDQRPCCAAFPDGIPYEISYGDNLHLAPVKGDNGIQFEADDDK